MGRFDLAAALRDVAPAFAAPRQPEAGFTAFAAHCEARVGFRLFTLLAWMEQDNDTQRIFSSNPVDYPTSARKPMGVTGWGAHVLRGHRPWIGRTAEDMRWAFPDHELIARLGCASCINALVMWDGRLLGVASMLDAAQAYDEDDLAGFNAVAPLLVPGFLAFHQGVRNT